jgi:hypothetical protein
MGDELSAGESRALRGCDHLLRGAAAWLTAADVEKHAVRAAVGRAIGGALAGWFTGGLAYELGPSRGRPGLVLALSVWAAGAPAVEDEEDSPTSTAWTRPCSWNCCTTCPPGGNVHLSPRRRAAASRRPGRTGPGRPALCRAAGVPTKPGVASPAPTQPSPPASTGTTCRPSPTPSQKGLLALLVRR